MYKKIFISLLILSAIAGCIYYFYTKDNNENNSNYETNKTSSNIEVENNTQTNTENNVIEQSYTSVVEEVISSFSTKIHNKDSARQNNITITSSTLNGTEVPAGATFSFCDTVGKATSDKGYQEADIFTSDGEKTKGLGGGNCQISTTLYNAVLAVPSLTVTERHEHSNSVPYIEDGKDAAVAYGSYDFKFINNTGYTVKILAENTENDITITLVQLK